MTILVHNKHLSLLYWPKWSIACLTQSKGDVSTVSQNNKSALYYIFTIIYSNSWGKFIILLYTKNFVYPDSECGEECINFTIDNDNSNYYILCYFRY